MAEFPSKELLTDLRKRLESQRYPFFFSDDAALSAVYHEEQVLLSEKTADASLSDALFRHIYAYASELSDGFRAMRQSYERRRGEISEMQESVHAACEAVLSHPLFQPSAGILFTVPEKDRIQIALSALSLSQRLEACMRADQIPHPPVPSTVPARTQALRALCCLYRDDLTEKCVELLNTVASETQRIIESEKILRRLYHLRCDILMMLTEFRSETLACLSFRESGAPIVASLAEIQRLSTCIKAHRTRLNHILKSKLEEMENSYEALHPRA